MLNDNKENKDIADSELLYRRVFETAQDGILLLDFETGMITGVNKFLVDLIGFSKEELLNKHLWEIGLFKDIAASKENFLELQNKGHFRFEDLPIETKDGRKIQVEFVSNAYKAADIKVIQCNIRDISFRKIAEHDLKDHYEQIEALNKMMMDRETKMIELKDEISDLKAKLTKNGLI